MTHPYPPHLPDFSYVGKYNYSLNFTTFDGQQFFTDGAAVDLVRSQILRASGEQAMELTAYCFMPDHVHLIVRGITDTSDCLKFIARAKQYSGFVGSGRYSVRELCEIAELLPEER